MIYFTTTQHCDLPEYILHTASGYEHVSKVCSVLVVKSYIIEIMIPLLYGTATPNVTMSHTFRCVVQLTQHVSIPHLTIFSLAITYWPQYVLILVNNNCLHGFYLHIYRGMHDAQSI